MSRMIDADALLEEYMKFHDGKRSLLIDTAPTVDAIPTEWIRQQMCDYPGMESAMWDKLLRLWREEVRKRW